MKRMVVLAVVAACQFASASQLRSDAEIRQIVPEGDFETGNDDFFSRGEDALLTFEFDNDAPGRASQLTFSWAFFDPRRAKRVE